MSLPFVHRKAEFCLENVNPESKEVCTLKSGMQLTITFGDDSAEFCNSENVVLGSVSSTKLDGFKDLAAAECRVRTLRRNSEGGVCEVVVRVTERRGSIAFSNPHPPREGASLEEEADEEGWRVKQAQFELLVSNEALRNMVADERLERDLRKIDSAQDREKALDAALLNPDFKIFTDKLLDAIHPQ
ncbi:hypothetical protein BSKO_11599 [Bryopsis sp. KO-2023]|nr:hypothetical protein BSKO_11599 [Bryopsis sp. KO-2023]